jgi:hypothetical protein
MLFFRFLTAGKIFSFGAIFWPQIASNAVFLELRVAGFGYFSFSSSTTMTSMGLSPALTSEWRALGGMAGSQ